LLLASFLELSGAISVLHLQHSYALTVSTLQDVSCEDSWLEPKVLKCFYAACILNVEDSDSVVKFYNFMTRPIHFIM
jgi:hypothetical protein